MHLIPSKKKPRTEMAGNGGALTPHGDFPMVLHRMRDEFDRLLDRFAHAWPGSWEGGGWRWGMEVEDKDDAVIVRAEAPGFDAGDFDLQMRGDQLILHACRKAEAAGQKTMEWSEHECCQAVTLPPGLDANKVDARYHNGVLTVKFPKTAEGKVRRITVKNV